MGRRLGFALCLAALSDFSEGEGVCLRLTDPDGKVLW